MSLNQTALEPMFSWKHYKILTHIYKRTNTSKNLTLSNLHKAIFEIFMKLQ